MRRVLVTGARGCVGRQALPILAGRDWEVHACTRAPHPPSAGVVAWHHVDLLDRTAAAALIDRVKPTHLLHLAWDIAPGRWAAAPENLAWVDAGLALFRTFASGGGTRVVGAGSCLEYDWTYGWLVEGRTPCRPHTLYGSCKHALQVLLDGLAASAGMSAAWGRIFFLYGPGEHPDRLVASVIRSLLAGEPARTSHGRQVRDYLHARDVARAFVALLESAVTGPINIASGQPVSLRDIVLRVGDLVGRPDLIRLGAIPPAPTDTPVVVADTHRLSSELQWHPEVDLDTGLRDTIDWWRTSLSATAMTAGES